MFLRVFWKWKKLSYQSFVFKWRLPKQGLSFTKSYIEFGLLNLPLLFQVPVGPINENQQGIDPRSTEVEVNTEKQDFDVRFEDEKPLLRETRSPHHGEEHHGMNF